MREISPNSSAGGASLGVGNVSFYGQKTDASLVIVMVETFTNDPAMTDVTFAFNFTAA